MPAKVAEHARWGGDDQRAFLHAVPFVEEIGEPRGERGLSLLMPVGLAERAPVRPTRLVDIAARSVRALLGGRRVGLRLDHFDDPDIGEVGVALIGEE